MTVQQFIEQRTTVANGAGISVGALRRRFQAECGPINRSQFLLDLAAAGIPILSSGADRAIVCNRAWNPQASVVFTG